MSLLPPDDRAGDDPIIVVPRTDELRCQFCECTLTGDGEVLRMSKRAKSLRDHEDDLEDAKRDLIDAQKVIDRDTTTIAALRADVLRLTTPTAHDLSL